MRRPSIGSFLNSLAAAVSRADPAVEEDRDDVRPRAGPRQPGDVDVTTLDTCTFGPHRLIHTLSQSHPRWKTGTSPGVLEPFCASQVAETCQSVASRHLCALHPPCARREPLPCICSQSAERPGQGNIASLPALSWRRALVRRLVLPPTAIRLIPGDSWSDRAKSFLRGASKKKKKAGHSKAPSSGAPQVRLQTRCTQQTIRSWVTAWT